MSESTIPLSEDEIRRYEVLCEQPYLAPYVRVPTEELARLLLEVRALRTEKVKAVDDELTVEDAVTLRRIGTKCAKKDYCSCAPFETSYCRTQRYCEEAAQQIEDFIEIRDEYKFVSPPATTPHDT